MSSSHLKPYVILTLLCGLLYFSGLFSLPIVDRDSPHFAQATRQMVQNHDYLHINFQNKPRHLKPPGIYWLQAPFVKFFGHGTLNQPWLYRLPSVLGGWLAVLLTFGFTRRFYGERVALLAAAFLGASVLLTIESHLVVTDAMLLMTMVWMQGSLWRIYVDYKASSHSRESGNPGSTASNVSSAKLTSTAASSHCTAAMDSDLDLRVRGGGVDLSGGGVELRGGGVDLHGGGISFPWFHPLMFWLGMSAGILIKGITPLVGGLTILALCLADKNVRWLKALKASWGLPLLIVLTLAWLLPVSFAGHSNFLMNMIGGDVVPKLVGGQQSHGMPPGYFIFIFTLMFWPGSLFFWHGANFVWKKRKSAAERFLLAWFIPTWIFFAIIPTKLPEYVLPVYPAIAIFIAYAVINAEKIEMHPWMQVWNRVYYVIWGLYSFAIAGMVIGLCYYLQHSISAVAIFSSSVIVIATIWALIWAFQHKLKQTAVMMITVAVIAIVPFYQFELPKLSNLWVSYRVAQQIQIHHLPVNNQHPLLSIGYGEPSLVFDLNTKAVKFSSIPQALHYIKQHHEATVLVNNNAQDFWLQQVKSNGMDSQAIFSLSGYNFSRGKWVTLDIYTVKTR